MGIIIIDRAHAHDAHAAAQKNTVFMVHTVQMHNSACTQCTVQQLTVHVMPPLV